MLLGVQVKFYGRINSDTIIIFGLRLNLPMLYLKGVYLDLIFWYIATGDIAFRILDEMKKDNRKSIEEDLGHVTVCDINKSMLEVGQDRAKKVFIDQLKWGE